MASVFLSHAGANATRDCLTTILERALEGTNVWHSGRLGMGRWDPQILAELDRCHALLVLGTPGILSSVYVGFEIGFVEKRLGASAISILRAGVDSDQLNRRPPLGHYQHYDSTMQGVRTLLGALSNRLSVPLRDAVDLGPSISLLESLAKQEIETPTAPPVPRKLSAVSVDLVSMPMPVAQTLEIQAG